MPRHQTIPLLLWKQDGFHKQPCGKELHIVCLIELLTTFGLSFVLLLFKTIIFLFFFQCTVLNEKLNLLLNTLSIESEALSTPSRESSDTSGNSGIGSGKPRVFVSKEALMSRANSLKKALKHIIEHAEKGTVWMTSHVLCWFPLQVWLVSNWTIVSYLRVKIIGWCRVCKTGDILRLKPTFFLALF